MFSGLVAGNEERRGETDRTIDRYGLGYDGLRGGGRERALDIRPVYDLDDRLASDRGERKREREREVFGH